MRKMSDKMRNKLKKYEIQPKKNVKNKKQLHKQKKREEKYKNRNNKQIGSPQLRPQSASPSSIINSHFEEGGGKLYKK